ncbi:MAG: sterol desaturase family protein [Ignavibacteria bacterium]|nr:sterol desaturase family protein [Ignavibacteria bacterium]
MKLYVSNKKETPRMFENEFLEFGTRVHWTIPLFVYIPLNAWLVYYASAAFHTASTTIAALFAAGLAVWTLTEYTLHRFVFHYHPTSDLGKKIHWMFHGVHHDYPSDPLRLVMPPTISIPLALLFYAFFRALMGAEYSTAFMPGFLTGYLFYDISHFAVHHFPIKGRFFGAMREHHMRHHFKDPDAGFGVSSPLWDVVFRTVYK